MKINRNAAAARRFSRRLLLRAAAASAALPFVARAQKKTHIVVWTWGGTERFNRRVVAFEQQFPEAASRIEVEVLSPGQHDPEVYQAFRLALASGKNVPDLLQMNYTGMPEFAEAGVLADLGDMMKPYAADLVDGARQLATYNGAIVSVPYQMKGKVWFHRKDLFEQAGIDPAAVASFDDYMTAGRRFHEKHPRSYIMNFGRSPIHYWYFEILSNWPDVRMADRDGVFRIRSDPHFSTMLDWMKAWRTSGIAFDTDDFAPTWQPAFADDSIAGSLISNWMTDFLPKFAPAQAGRWGLTMWPAFSRAGSEGGGSIMTIPAASKNKEAAFEFAAAAFLTPAGSLGEWERTGTPTVLKSAMQEMLDKSAHLIRPAGMPDAVWAALPNNFFGPDFLRPILQAFEQFHPFAYDPAAQAELDIMRRETEAYITGAKTREQALEAMQATMTTQIGNPYHA
jgi:ABC-type glycerol-3-phosphate transport system substrate-binding protein